MAGGSGVTSTACRPPAVALEGSGAPAPTLRARGRDPSRPRAGLQAQAPPPGPLDQGDGGSDPRAGWDSSAHPLNFLNSEVDENG